MRTPDQELRLEGIFRAIDENGTGIITEERLTHVLGIPKAGEDSNR